MSDKPTNIVLIGFASTGKSTTGRALADRLGRRFIDLDEVVEALHVDEKGEKRRCREIYSLWGRECFIDMETRALSRLRDIEGAVIATGGGTPISETNRSLIKALGIVVYLNATVGEIFHRMSLKGYPQYLGPNPTIADLEALWSERHPVYLATADTIIDNTEGSPEGVAEQIITDIDLESPIAKKA